MDYDVLVSFAGYVGSEQLYSVVADDEDEAIEAALAEARDDLSVEDVRDMGDGEFQVDVNFAGLVGVTETYTVSSADEDEASVDAINEAEFDLDAEGVEEL